MFTREYPVAVPVIGVPVPGKTNPYIISTTSTGRIRVEVDIAESEKTRVFLKGKPQPKWSLEIAVKSYVDVISERLEEKVEVEVSFTSPIELPMSVLFAAISTAVIEAVVEAGGYSFTRSEILEAAKSIDSDAGTDYDYISGLRLAMLGAMDKVFVYREGEEPISLEGAEQLEVEFVGEEPISFQSPERYGDSILSIAAKLAGINIVETVERLRNGYSKWEVFELASRIDNALYYSLYGLIPLENCKWVPSFQAGFGLCKAGSGMGEKVGIYL